MNTTDPWADPEIQVTDEYYGFPDGVFGTTASGVVKWVGKHQYDDGKVVPSLILVDDVTGEDKTLNAGQIRLKHLLLEKRPMPGNHLKVVYVSDESRGAGKSMKHFSVDVNVAGAVAAPVAQAAPVVAVAATEAAPVDLAAAAKALGLDETQLAALKNLQPQA